MLPYKRSKRVGDLLRDEIANILIMRVKDPRLGFLTVTSVEVSDDLRHARVYISILDKKTSGSVIEALRSARGFIRSELRKRVRLRIIPEIDFFEDKSIEYGTRIDELLESTREEDGESS